MNTKLVVFDIAGTTVADDDSVNDAFRGALEKAGYPVVPEEVNYIMGYRKIEAIKILLERFYPGEVNNETLIQAIHDQFTIDMRAYYLATPNLYPLPFAEDVFKLLHSNNIKIGLNTGFTKVITDTIMQRLGWDKNGLVDVIISSDEVPMGRPFPYMIQAIMNRLNITESKQVVKVGDTEVDIAEGRNAGCGLVVSVTTGSYS
ncbi:MAG: HAD-IA family hydrolase, partial [Ferruginibacter sp.]